MLYEFIMWKLPCLGIKTKISLKKRRFGCDDFTRLWREESDTRRNPHANSTAQGGLSASRDVKRPVCPSEWGA